MNDKKNEDYGEKGEYRSRSNSPSQKEPFLSKVTGSSSSGGSVVPSSLQSFQNSPPLSVIAYCLSSISMTVTNKYCVSGSNWNLNFFYLAIQVC